MMLGSKGSENAYKAQYIGKGVCLGHDIVDYLMLHFYFDLNIIIYQIIQKINYFVD